MTEGEAPRPGARLRVLVVEDEWVARNYLTELLEASGMATVVAAVATAEVALEALQPAPRGLEVDAVFLDVHLGQDVRAGMELARSVTAVPGGPLVVLATAYEEHALDAYDLGVVDYLRKPFTADRVARCLRRVQALSPGPRSVTRARRVVARKGRSLVFLRVEDVWAFEAAGRLVSVHSSRGRLDMDLSLTAIETQLAGQVLRVHRNWLVQVDRVLELVRDGPDTSLLVGSDAPDAGPALSVPVTRERSAEVRAALLERLLKP